MSRLGPRVLAAINIALAVMLAGAAPLSTVRAQGEPDRSDVVLVLDFSASILDEPATRNRFGAALERIADRVEATSADLIAGDTTMTIIQFASKAANYGGCVDLQLLGSPGAVAQFAHCLRSVASAYRKGLDPALSRKIGIDTNYVAAMELAAKHLPADAMRPALIMFTDGRHDVRGVPASQVKVTRDRLFASRAPFALLPVGMGLDPKKRNALESGLAGLRIVSGMPPCVSGQTFDWPKVVFETADEAGNAVAVALQDATCTFTLPPTSVVPPAPGVVRGIRLTARDRSIQLSWSPPTATPVPVVGYRARCRADVGDWVEATVGASPSTTATIDGLTNGVAYRCEVAAVGSESDGAWTAALTSVIPLGRPAAPAKPTVEALDGSVRISIAPAGAADPADVSGYHYECSADGGVTWSAAVDVGAADSTAQVGNLTNGVQYVCRAYAANAVGRSEASALSDAVIPCGSPIDCNPLLRPILGILGVVLAGGLLAAFVALYRERSNRGYVVAVVDVIHTANLGHGSRLGIAFVRAPDKRVTGIVPDRGSKPDVRVRHLRGDRFEVTDRTGRHVAASGERMVVVDPGGGRHDLVLRAFATNTASAVSARR
jgi:fibronectin type III domain protein